MSEVATEVSQDVVSNTAPTSDGAGLEEVQLVPEAFSVATSEKKKKKGFFGHEGVLLGCSLAGFVVCGFASVAWLGILPKVACHGDDGR